MNTPTTAEHTMFCGMAISTAKPGKLDELVAAALDHARALRRQPGCVDAYVLSDRSSPGQVSLSIFETEEAFQHALEATRPVIARHRIEQLVEGPPTFRLFDVR